MNESNVILTEPMRNRTMGSMLEAYEAIIQQLLEGEALPMVNILDKKCSRDFEQTMFDNQMSYQLVPSHNHRRNAAKKMI